MLTSFFNNSKPIHFVFVAIYMTVFYCLANFVFLEAEISLAFVLEKIVGWVSFLLIMFILNFIAKRNYLTKNNSYKILLFACFSALFVEALQNTDIILANFFVVLAIRRAIALKTQRFSKEKIFDSVFWICIASLFSFWTISFLVLAYLAILISAAKNFKHWLIPPVAALAVYLIVTAVNLILHNEFYGFQDWFQSSNYDFSYYRNWEILIPLSMLLALTLWTLLNFLFVLQKASAVVRPAMVIVLLYLVTSALVGVLSATKNTGELIFYFIPLSIIVAKYFDDAPDRWFKESLLWVLVLLPFVLLFV